jgi:outer membrane autotransporter protein
VALAQACDVACDAADAPRLAAWISGLGGVGTVGGNGNAGAFSYNFGGSALGADYRVDQDFLVGLAVGYTTGQQWVGGFQGNGNTENYGAALYGSFTQGAFYTDALAGYAYSDSQMRRPIQIPGLAARVANGRTGANQFLGQVETGYRFDIYAPAQASLTPFARFQTVAAFQNGFTENGADSLDLNVAAQNTLSVRTVVGATLAGTIPVGDHAVTTSLRLGWAHEHADTTRPMTAAFAGAPTSAFTVQGAQSLRDAAVIGLGFNTQIAAATSLYARYDGEITGRDDAHAFSAGLRMTW